MGNSDAKFPTDLQTAWDRLMRAELIDAIIHSAPKSKEKSDD